MTNLPESTEPSRKIVIMPKRKVGHTDAQPAQPAQPADLAIDKQMRLQTDQTAKTNQPGEAGGAGVVGLAGPIEPKYVFGQLVLTAKQVKLSKLLADQLPSDTTDTSDPTDATDPSDTTDTTTCLGCVGWPEYAVSPQTTALLQLWFDGTPTDQLCQMHGLVGLDKLLAVANWLGIQDCVDQIVDTSIVHAKPHTRRVDQASRAVYTQLASQASFPPVSIDWPGVAELCWLCGVMPTILTRNLQMVWVDKLLVGPAGPIRQLYRFRHFISSTPDMSDIGLTMRANMFFAANGFFAVHEDDKVCRLIKLDPACSAGRCGKHGDDNDDDDDDDNDDDNDHGEESRPQSRS